MPLRAADKLAAQLQQSSWVARTETGRVLDAMQLDYLLLLVEQPDVARLVNNGSAHEHASMHLRAE